MHFTTDLIACLDLEVPSIVEARYKVIEGIAKVVKQGGFFYERMSPSWIEHTNDLIENTSLSDVESRVQQALAHGQYNVADTYQGVALFNRLRQEGITFDFRLTEEGEDEIQVYEALPEVTGLSLAELDDRFPNMMELMIHLMQETELSANDVNLLLYGEAAKRRDIEILENIRERGSEENILWVGRGHKLETISQTGLDWYRVDIDATNGNVQVSGNLPGRFEQTLTEIPTRLTYGRELEMRVEFD